MAEVIFDLSLLDAPSDETLNLSSEFDADADYNAPPPPLPDGWYQATLTVAGVRDADGNNVLYRVRPCGNIRSTCHTSINARIIDPSGPQDGKFASDNTVTTHLDPKRYNTSKVATYYRGITGNPIPGVNEEDHVKSLCRELLSQPMVWIKTQLEGQPADASKAFSDAKKANGGRPVEGTRAPKTYRGERNFYENGKLTGRVFDEETGEWVVGRPVISDVKPLSFVPPVKK